MGRALHLVNRVLLGRASAPAAVQKVVPSQSVFGGMVKKQQRALHALTAKLAAGKIDIDAWYEGFRAVILEGHTSAWELGRNRAGDLTDDINDLLRGLGKADQEEVFLRGFWHQLYAKDPRYWNSTLEAWNQVSIKARQNLYLGGMRGTANEAFVTHTPPELDTFAWKDTGSPEECDECRLIAEEGPYTSATLPTYPGAGATPCWGNCECVLVRTDGVQGFKRVEL